LVEIILDEVSGEAVVLVLGEALRRIPIQAGAGVVYPAALIPD
jgi:hypothetical protein